MAHLQAARSVAVPQGARLVCFLLIPVDGLLLTSFKPAVLRAVMRELVVPRELAVKDQAVATTPDLTVVTTPALTAAIRATTAPLPLVSKP